MSGARFRLPIKILFQHCDPAGIVFYPRYFEMVNQVVEAWFETGLDYSFAAMHGPDGYAVPTVTVQADFPAMSRLGEALTFSLGVAKLGRTSLSLDVQAICGGETRLTARPVLVHVHTRTGRPAPWPEAVRGKMAGFQTSEPIL